MAHYELHAWCLLVLAWVFVPFYMRVAWSSRCRSSWNGGSRPARATCSRSSRWSPSSSRRSPWAFSPAAWCSARCCRRCSSTSGRSTSTASGSARSLVIVLTGLYTVLGGMRAVAYNDAVQTIILIIGSALLTVYGLIELGGWSELRRICGSDMFNLWKPLVPAGVEGTWAPGLEKDAAGQVVQQAWYFNDNFPWLGMLFCAPIIGLWYWCTDQYIVQRALGAPERDDRPPRQHLRRVPQALPGVHFIIPGMICFALAKSGKVPGLASHDRSRRQADRATHGPGGVPADGEAPAARRAARHRGGRPALGADGLAGRRVQRLLDALHRRPLREVEAQGHAAPTRADRPHRHGRDGADRAGLDPGDQGRARAVRLPAGRAGLSGAADLRGVLPRRVLEAAQRPGLPLGHGRGLHAGHLPHAGRHAGHAGTRRASRTATRTGSLLLDRQQHLLPVLQRADHDRLRGRDGRREPAPPQSPTTRGSRA